RRNGCKFGEALLRPNAPVRRRDRPEQSTTACRWNAADACRLARFSGRRPNGRTARAASERCCSQMRSKYVLIPFILVLIAAPVAFALATYLGGPTSGSNVTRSLFAMTVVVEALALSQAIMARKLFSPSDPGRVTWTLIVAFLMVRLIASLRHASLIYG